MSTPAPNARDLDPETFRCLLPAHDGQVTADFWTRPKANAVANRPAD